ncbi:MULTISPECIES: PspA/IM30 family protein [unclassified Azospirillum]|uniref:PspA/IM30 family protein n=1 Tax=unclassified Azospirillum TaxID=2630922 RepID=UPI000B66EF82|nr:MULTISPECIES: PspA/IM30 family protein [unclassified Azospirillum]SNR97723.1 phage shock protein A (PspA) family protein [Azospirillum sp. RU38E]SNS14864.1 phage shock protein A (PspA) family protein [Azospirillum sp. RU37A]
MGLIDRIGDVINANLSSLLDRAEDPEIALNQAIREMEDTLSELRCGTVRMIAERKGLSESWRAAEFEMLEWERKAETALTHGREDLARAALAAREEIRRAAAPAEAELQALTDAIARMTEDARQLEGKLAEAHARRRTLAARYRGAVDRLRARTTLYDGRLDEAMARCAEIDREIDWVEAKGETLSQGRPRDLSAEIAALESQGKVDEELAALKKRLAERADRA